MTLERQFIKHKSSLIYRGIGALTLGLVALCYPGEGIYALAFPFGVLLFLSGIINIIRYVSYRSNKSHSIFSPIGKGSIELLIGILSFVSIVLSIDIFWELISIWIITSGIFQIVTFSKIRQIMEDWKVMIVLGNLAVVFGASMLVNNSLKMITPTYELAIFAIFYGSCFIYIYFKLKEQNKYLKDRHFKVFKDRTKAVYERVV